MLPSYSNQRNFFGSTEKKDPYANYFQQNNQNKEAIPAGGLNMLTHDYNQTVAKTVNNLNRRGLFGSSIASEDIGKVNYAFGQGAATLAAKEAESQQKNLIEFQKLQQEQGIFGQKMQYLQQQQSYKNQFQQEQLKMQKTEANRAAGRPDWW